MTESPQPTIVALFVVLAGSAFASSGCKSVECGDATIERNGVCVPADEVVDPAICGPFTVLVGGHCVPMFPPTVCDETSTNDQLDDATGVVTCIGTAAGFSCPSPDSGKMTICGQLYDLETGAEFKDANAQCTQCATSTETGVCSIGIRSLDAVKFALDPTDPGAALASDAVYLDDCGRFKVANITLPTANPFVALAIDDANPANRGPAGTTNAIGIATAKAAGVALKNFEGFVAPSATTTKWAASGGPSIASGMYVALFRAMSTGFANQAGVSILRNGQAIANDDHYFQPGLAVRTTVDPAASLTGANGTVLVTSSDSAGVQLGKPYGAAPGPLPAACAWEGHAGVVLAGLLFVQIFRPIDATGQTCPL